MIDPSKEAIEAAIERLATMLKAAYAIDFAALQGQLEKCRENGNAAVKELQQQLAESEAQYERISKKLQLSHENCACEYEKAGDVCKTHFPAKQALEDQLTDTMAEVERLKGEDSLRNKALNSSAKDVGQMLEDLDQQNAKLKGELVEADGLLEDARHWIDGDTTTGKKIRSYLARRKEALEEGKKDAGRS